jgi:hypothetical protein
LYRGSILGGEAGWNLTLTSIHAEVKNARISILHMTL